MPEQPGLLTRWADGFTRFLSYVAAAGIFSLMALVFISVFFRYVLNSPILATEDSMAILLGVTIFTAVPAVTRTRSHITVELLTAPFKLFPLIDRIRRILIDLGVIAMTLYMTHLLYLQAVRQYDRGTETPVMEWAVYPVTFAFVGLILIGAILFAPHVIRDRGDSDTKGGLDL